jgi:hypothetical protein
LKLPVVEFLNIPVMSEAGALPGGSGLSLRFKTFTENAQIFEATLLE